MKNYNFNSLLFIDTYKHTSNLLANNKKIDFILLYENFHIYLNVFAKGKISYFSRKILIYTGFFFFFIVFVAVLVL